MRRAAWAWGVAVALGPLAWALTRLVEPAWVEANFVQGIGQPVAAAIGVVTGAVDWPVGEAGIVGLAGLVLAAIVGGLVRSGRAARIRWALPRLLAIASVGYAVFVAIWGLNYRREPLWVAFGYPEVKPTRDEVRALSAELVAATNVARGKVPEGEGGVARLAGDFPDAALRAQDVYARAAARWPFLGGRYARAKPLFASETISYGGLGGIYLPFTAEPNVNVDQLPFDWPFDICHEMAHQRGVAREDEANFVAYVVARDYGDPDFVYGATLAMAGYAVSALEEVDPDTAGGLWANLGLGTRRDLLARKRRSEKYETPLRDVGREVNHTYLRSNGVDDGVQSYGRVVDLLVAERRLRRAVPKE